MTIVYVLVGFASASLGFYGFTRANSFVVGPDGEWGGDIVDHGGRVLFSLVCAAAGMGLLWAVNNLENALETCWGVFSMFAGILILLFAVLGLLFLLFRWFKIIERWALR
jgi:hypothetical protein